MKKTHLFLLLIAALPVLVYGQKATDSDKEAAVKMVKQIYTEVSAENEDQVDWERIRSFFAEGATILLRTTREATTKFTVGEFIQDFKDFYGSPRMQGLGFKETVLALESRVYKDMAYIGVLYGAQILKEGVPMQKGIDFWLLTRTEEGWKVLTVTNEVVLPGDEIPGSLLPAGQ